MANLVLVHGAMHGAWCWEHVAPLLSGMGHAVRAIDLPGLGDDVAACMRDLVDKHYPRAQPPRVAV
jgi:alpha-beta hydrolase superfamily lysophospholipase